MIVRELVTRLGFETDERALRQYEHGVNNVKQSVERMSTAMKAALGGVAAGIAVGIGKALTDASERVGTLQARLNNLAQRADINSLARNALDTNNGLEDYAKNYIRLADATQGVLRTQQDVTAVLDALNDGMHAAGANASEASSAIQQLARGLSQGSISGMQFARLSETGGPILREMARAILGPNGTVPALRAMADDGKLTTDVVLRAIRQIAPELKRQAGEVPRTLGMVMGDIKDKMLLAAYNLDRATGFTRRLVAAMDWLANMAERVIGAMGGVSHIVQTLGATIGSIAVVTAPIMIRAVLAITASLWTMLAPIAPFIAGFAALYAVIDDVLHWIKGRPSLAGELFGDFDQYAQRIRDVLDDIKRRIQQLFGAWRSVGQGIIKAINGDASGAVSSIKSGVGSAADATGLTAGYNAVRDMMSSGFERLFGRAGGNPSVSVVNNVTVTGVDSGTAASITGAIERGNERIINRAGAR